MRPSHRSGSLVLAVAALSVSAMCLPAGAGAATAPAVRISPASNGQEQVTLFLTPPNRAALHRLAADTTLSRRSRAQALARLVPSATSRRQVESGLRALGLTVTASGRWSVSGTGPAWLIDAEFGSARAVRPHARVAQALPQLPSRFRGLVTAAFGGDEVRPAALPLATPGYRGADFRAAYGYAGVDGTVAGGAPAPTIATVQLSGWDARTLSAYAAANALPDPLRNGQYTAIDVENGSASTSDGAGGDAEVALDQEALLSVAPHARQRAYFTDNSEAGFADAIYAVGDDATDGTHDGYRLTALSISWGDCEQDWSPTALETMDDALTYVVAAGVTTFAAAGDDGAYGCYDGSNGVDRSLAVDFPASDPSVVAVGGTSLPTTGGQETAWAGSGGGESHAFAKPAYQSAISMGSGGRLVPDIAVDADPQTGFAVLIGASGRTPAHWDTAGGTSLAAPLAAGLLTDSLANDGYTYGVGDIHQSLYTAPAGELRDITAGSNPGIDQHGRTIGTGLPAAVGYDEVTGLGAPLWNEFAADVLGQAAPHVRTTLFTRTATVPVTVSAPHETAYTYALVGADDKRTCSQIPTVATVPTSYTLPHLGWNAVTVVAKDTTGRCHIGATAVLLDTTRPVAHASVVPYSASAVTVAWAGTDPSTTAAPGSGVAHYGVRVFSSGKLVYSTPSTTARSLRLPAGPAYVAVVTAVDGAGNVSAPATSTMLDDRALAIGSGWSRPRSTAEYGGSALASGVRGRSAAARLAGSAYAAVVTTGPSGGELAVYIDGHLARVLDTYSSTTHYRVTERIGGYHAGTHTVRCVVMGAHDRHSRGTTVVLDAVTAAA